MPWTYKCGHTSNCIIMDTDVMSVMAYLEWADTVGVNGTMKKCFECYCKKVKKQC